MKTKFSGKRISSIIGIVPELESFFDDEVENYPFPAKQTLKLKKVMGYEKHRVVKPGTAASDLCIYGLDYLLGTGIIRKEEIGAIIVATTFPDHFIPPVSSLIQGHYQLPDDVVCLDISQGCVAFVIGLMEAFLILDHLETGKKALVFATDVLSKKVSKQDRNSYPLIGDGAGIAVVENDPSAKDIPFVLHNNGAMGKALIIPAGGSRMPSNAETAEMRDFNGDGNLRSLDNLTMDGTGVFNFVQSEVPPMINELLSDQDLSIEDIDWFLFHQPNKFMLRKLAEKIGIPYEKMPMNLVENFGNSSGATIPICLTFNLSEKMKENVYRCCLASFGSGLTWGAMIVELGNLDVCELLVSNC